MKNVFKNPMKVIVVGLFLVAMSIGMFTSLSVFESSNDVNLLALSSAVAQDESSTNNKKALARKSDGTFCCKPTTNVLNNSTSSPDC